MLAQYEEKTFESYFNSELDQKSSIYFPFGQVQEGGIGADCAAMSRDTYLWNIFNSELYYGKDLDEISRFMNECIENKIKHIPSITVNILFQYKRPEFITTANGKEWHHWKKNYFRYSIYKEQQSLLEKIYNEFGKDVLILYASPAIYDRNDLVSAKIGKKIIESTNFCRADHLKGHNHNTYTKAGNICYACSEPEEIPSFNLIENLQEFKTQDSKPITIISKFTSELRSIVEKDPYLGESYRLLLQPYKDLGLEEFNFLFGNITMNILKQLTGIQWIIATNEK